MSFPFDPQRGLIIVPALMVFSGKKLTLRMLMWKIIVCRLEPDNYGEHRISCSLPS